MNTRNSSNSIEVHAQHESPRSGNTGKFSLRRSAVFIALLTMSGCDYNATAIYSPDPLTPAGITVSGINAAPLTSTGETRVLSAVVLDRLGHTIDGATIEWRSSAPNVVAVSNNASASVTITALGDGTASIIARSGSIERSISVVVRRTISRVTLSVPLAALPLGASTRLVTQALDARGNVIPNLQGFVYRSNNPGSLFVQPDGTVTGLFRLGQTNTAKISATITRDGITLSDTVAMTLVPPQRADFVALLLNETVVPRNPLTTGSGLVHIERRGDTLNTRIFWSSLSSRVMSVEIHGPARYDEIGDLLINIGPVPANDSLGLVVANIRASDIRMQNGRAAISLDSLMVLMCNQLAYADVRTTQFPGGEIRGPLGCIP